MPTGDAVGAGDLDRGRVEHEVGLDGAGDPTGDLREGVGGHLGGGQAGAARRPSSQSAADTSGLKCAPETGPNSRISTASLNAVAVEFSSSCNPTLPGESAAAAIPDPTTTVTRSAVPTNSASGRRPSGSDVISHPRDRVDSEHLRQVPQDKVWVSGPAGEKWEVYTVLADSETFGSSPQHLDGSQDAEGDVCCGAAAPTKEQDEKEPTVAENSCR